MTATKTQSVLHQLFDLVAPIAITGGADSMFETKAKQAWRVIARLPDGVWQAYECPVPDRTRLIGDRDDLGRICYDFAYDAYSALFEAIVAENGISELEKGYDYYGAKGYKLPGDSRKQFTLSGDASGFYPWYETAELLVEKLDDIRKQIADSHWED